MLAIQEASPELVSEPADTEHQTHLELAPIAESGPAPAAKQLKEPERAPLQCADPDLEWLLRQGDATMGHRGTLAGVVSQIERGSVGGSGNLDAAGSYCHPYTDLQLGTGARVTPGDVEKHRWLTRVWRQLPQESRDILLVRYSAPRAELRSDSGFGARIGDKWVKGSDARPGSHGMFTTRVSDLLGEEFAALCFALCEDQHRLLLACQDPQPHLRNKDGNVVVNKDGNVVINRSLESERSKTRGRALKVARAADAEAHQHWFEAKCSVAGMRLATDRTGVRQRAASQAPARPSHSSVVVLRRLRSIALMPEATFGDHVRVAMIESGLAVAVPELAEFERKPTVEEVAAECGALPKRPLRGDTGLLGLLLDHADEAL